MDYKVAKISIYVFAAVGTYAAVRWIFKKENTVEKQKESTVECLFFTPTFFNDKFHMKSESCTWFSCPTCNSKKLFKLIASSKTQLDICVCLITISDISDIVINLFSHGLTIRIITDKGFSQDGSSSKVVTFLRHYIPLKVIDFSEIMHNKFVIIDKKTVVTGSFNWTFQGLNNNFENGVIINDSSVVKNYNKYFQEMWNIPCDSLPKCL